VVVSRRNSQPTTTSPRLSRPEPSVARLDAYHGSPLRRWQKIREVRDEEDCPSGYFLSNRAYLGPAFSCGRMPAAPGRSILRSRSLAIVSPNSPSIVETVIRSTTILPFVINCGIPSITVLAETEITLRSSHDGGRERASEGERGGIAIADGAVEQSSYVVVTNMSCK
jgi:hypothetical protein